VSTAEQGQSGLGLEAQRAAVRAFAAAQGWTLVAEFSDVASGRDDRRLPDDLQQGAEHLEEDEVRNGDEPEPAEARVPRDAAVTPQRVDEAALPAAPLPRERPQILGRLGPRSWPPSLIRPAVASSRNCAPARSQLAPSLPDCR